MTILHLENEHRRINISEEIGILKATPSRNVFNDIINRRSDPVKRLLLQLVLGTSRDERLI